MNSMEYTPISPINRHSFNITRLHMYYIMSLDYNCYLLDSFKNTVYVLVVPISSTLA